MNLKILRDFIRKQTGLAIQAPPDVRQYERYGCRVRLGRDGTYYSVRKLNSEIRLGLLHKTYLDDITREFEYYFCSVVPEKRGRFSIADFSKPRKHSVPGIEHSFLFTSLPEGGSTNNAYLRTLKLSPGDTIIDAGAYCGLTSYLFSLAVGEHGLVVAVEADPNNFAALVANIEATGATNIHAVNVAIWKERATLKFQAEGIMGSSLSITGPRHDRLTEVATATLLDICDDLGLDRVDHVKMDIEGAEYAVVESSAEFVKRYRPDFLIEAHDEGETPVDVPRLKTFFEPFGYSMVRVKQSDWEVFPLLHFAPIPDGS